MKKIIIIILLLVGVGFIYLGIQKESISINDLAFITAQESYAADTKVSALPELAATPAGTDTLYIIDATVSKKITVDNLHGAYEPLLVNEAGLYSALSDVSNFLQEADLSANGFSLVTAADYAAMKVLLDLEIGTDIQAQDSTLQVISDNSGTVSNDGVDYSVKSITATDGFTSGPTATPFYSLNDSDSPGTDKWIGSFEGNYIDGADGAENADLFWYGQQAGSKTLLLQFDESDDQLEVNVNTALQTGDIVRAELEADIIDETKLEDNSVDSEHYNDASIDAIHLGPDADDDAIEFVIDGGGSAITTGVKGYLEVPYACTINSVTLLADQSGSIVIDIWVDSYANYPPLDADSITASAVPTITTAVKSQDSTLTAWTTSLAKGDIIGFNVDSITTVERVTLSLKVDK